MKSRGVVGVVLCGGESSRMGEDKAKLRVGERAMVDHVVGALSGACEEVVLACGTSPRYEDRGLKLVMDSSAGRGLLIVGHSRRSNTTFKVFCNVPMLLG